MADSTRKRAPAFSAKASNGATISLDDYRGKYLVLYFYPKSFTLGCTRETIAFRDAAAEIRALGAEILGVSRDPLEVQCKFAEHYQAGFPILSDEDGAISRAYGVVYRLVSLVKRVTFVIDPEGFIVARIRHEVRMDKHVDDVVAFLRGAALPASKLAPQ